MYIYINIYVYIYVYRCILFSNSFFVFVRNTFLLYSFIFPLYVFLNCANSICLFDRTEKKNCPEKFF